MPIPLIRVACFNAKFLLLLATVQVFAAQNKRRADQASCQILSQIPRSCLFNKDFTSFLLAEVLTLVLH
jgi:hypothetical protein